MLAEFGRENGSVISFYEFGPGLIVVSGAGKAGEAKPLTAEIDTSQMDAVEIYSYLAGEDAVVPEELLFAQIRADARRENKEIAYEEITTTESDAVEITDSKDVYYDAEHALKASPCSWTWFQDSLPDIGNGHCVSDRDCPYVVACYCDTGVLIVIGRGEVRGRVTTQIRLGHKSVLNRSWIFDEIDNEMSSSSYSTNCSVKIDMSDGGMFAFVRVLLLASYLDDISRL